MIGPRGLIIAAPSSGAGKTTVTLALIAALRAAGHAVRPYKVGPDYIDPTYLCAAAGQPCINLDPWAMRAGTLNTLVAQTRQDEIAIVEGVMGLHDGPGSTAALAHMTGWPILLVIDCAKSAQTAAALGEGLMARDPELKFAGFLFNRVASDRHATMIRDGLRSDMPYWMLPTAADLALPSRHLGLHLAAERSDLDEFLTQAANWLRDAIDLQSVLDVAASTSLPKGKSAKVLKRAQTWSQFGLTFAYPHFECPDDCIYLPGGYPELNLDAISHDPSFLSDLRGAAAAGVPIYGECGGFMVLGEAIIDADGQRHEMAGLLPVVTTFAQRKRHLGYRQIRALNNFALGHAGQKWRGHEFHYTQIEWAGAAEPLFHAQDAYGADLGPCGMRVGSVSGSYLHLIDQAP